MAGEAAVRLERINKYELLERIAVGGMGEVFLSRAAGEHGFEKLVAVKRIRSERANDPEFVVRFVSEAKLAVALAHANLVQVLDLARSGEELYLVMEYIHGPDFSTLLHAVEDRGQRVPLGIALHVATETLKGLTYAHERTDFDGHPRGVVHCDISPSNLLVSYAGEVKIADFGVAQVLHRIRRPTGQVMGKPRYMAPEQMRGLAVDGRADLYALGVVLRDALRGRTGEGEPASAEAPLPPELSELLERVLSPEPANRPASARSMLATLTQIARGVDPPVTGPDVGVWARELIPPASAGAESGGNGVMRLFGRGRPKGTASLSLTIRTNGSRPATATFVARGVSPGDATIWERLPDRRRWFRRHPVAASGGVLAAGVAAFFWVGAPGHNPLARIADFPKLSSLWEVAPFAAAPPAPEAALAPQPEALSPPPAELPSIAQPSPLPPPDPSPAPPVPPATPAPTLPSPRVPVRPSGYLNVYTEPWSYVWVDGKRVGSTPLLKLPVAPGSHLIRLQSPGGKPVERQVKVLSGSTEILDMDLDR
jgi:serine/threonine-protein kinase